MSNPRHLDITESSTGQSGYIRGDYDPKNFDYKLPINRQELLTLFLRNPKIQKATAWFANEILRERWKFISEQPISGDKHGQPFSFTSFNDWLEWMGFMQEAGKAIMWSLLFGEAILVFYDGTEQDAGNYKDGNKLFLKDGTNFVKCKAFYELNKGNGYTIEEIDNFFGIPKVYKIQLHAHKATANVTYYADAKTRVVRFSAPQKELKYSGTSSVTSIAQDCIVQEQIKRAVATQANMLQSGILAVKASSDTEKDLIDNEIGDSFSYLRRVYYTNPDEIENLFTLIVPDMKIDQLVNLSELLQKDIATGMDVSISNLEGAPQGALSSAEYDTLNTYAKVKQLQAHFTRAMEEAFFKLGKLDTTFEWFDPTPKAAIMNERTTNFNVSSGENDDDKISENSDGDDSNKEVSRRGTVKSGSNNKKQSTDEVDKQ